MADKDYLDKLTSVAENDVVELKRKDESYGGSWKKRGGVGAWMMAARKIDRLENQLQKMDYNIFEAIRDDDAEDGILDDLRDLRRYLMLIEAELVAQGVVSLP